MDKITCISFILYQSTSSTEVRELAIQLLNGDVSLRDLKRNRTILPHLVTAESLFKKNKLDKHDVQEFAEKFLLVESY